MKISQEAVTDAVVIKSYGDGFLLIQTSSQTQQRITTNCILSPQGVSDAPTLNVSPVTLTRNFFKKISSLNADVIILTSETGINSHTLNLTAQFAAADMTLETMSLGAACRTYNLLINEGRKPVLLVNF